MTTTVVKMKDGVTKFKGKETATLRFALKDCYFYFLTTAPRPNKGKKFDASFPAKDSSYSVQVLVTDKKVLKEITKSKSNPNGYTKVTTNTVDADEFEEQFKCKPPFEADEYTFLKLNRHAGYGDGATFDGAHYIPVVEIKDGKRVEHARGVIKAKRHADHEDKKCYDAIITETMIGNGTQGHVILNGSWYEFENETNQKPIQESFIITDLVPYVGSGSKQKEVSDDDMEALGLGGMEVVKAEPKPRNAAEELEQQEAGGDDEPLTDPDDDEDEGFVTE